MAWTEVLGLICDSAGDMRGAICSTCNTRKCATTEAISPVTLTMCKLRCFVREASTADFFLRSGCRLPVRELLPNCEVVDRQRVRFQCLNFCILNGVKSNGSSHYWSFLASPWVCLWNSIVSFILKKPVQKSQYCAVLQLHVLSRYVNFFIQLWLWKKNLCFDWSSKTKTMSRTFELRHFFISKPRSNLMSFSDSILRCWRCRYRIKGRFDLCIIDPV